MNENLRTSQSLTDAAYCPSCDCRKNGYATEPNATSDWCENLECACHTAETVA